MRLVPVEDAGGGDALWSKWFTRFLRGTAGITDPGKVFHSFRHTWKDLARNSKLPPDVHDAITGHPGGGVGRTYGAGFGLKVLAEEMARIEAPAALRDLSWQPRSPADK